MAEAFVIRKRLFMIIALAGMVVATLAGLSHYLEWLASLCTGFGQGCRETAEFSLFHIPLWIWGVGYYLLLLLLFLRGAQLISWMIAFGFGVELGLVWVMFSFSIVCLFCLANLVVMVALVLCSLELSRIWQTLSVTLAAAILSSLVIPYQNSQHTAPATSRKPTLAATIGGKGITYDELVLPMANRIYDLEEQIYRLQRDYLDQLLAKKVLDREAEQQGKSPQQLVKDFLTAQPVTVPEQEIADYYTENRARWADWKGSEQELMAQIRAYLQQLKTQQRLMEYAKSLYPRHDVEIYLKEPRSPTLQIRLEQDDPVFGPANAPLTIFEFSDYQCPACRKNHEVVRELREAYGDRVKWVFKDFPMPGHQWARGASLAARCAGDQGKFWEYQDLLFASQEELTTARLTQLAGELRLAMEPFNRCLETGQFQARLDRDIEQARKYGFNTTPTLVINNRVFAGAPPAPRFRQIIDEELAKLASESSRK